MEKSRVMGRGAALQRPIAERALQRPIVGNQNFSEIGAFALVLAGHGSSAPIHTTHW